MWPVKRPTWLMILIIVLLLWGLAGCFAFVGQLTKGADFNPQATDYDRALYASLPIWFNAVYGVAVISGLAGSAAMLRRSRAALVLYPLSLAAALLQFGYVFLETDLLAVKGWETTAIFPAFIIAIATLQVLLALYAARRRWIG